MSTAGKVLLYVPCLAVAAYGVIGYSVMPLDTLVHPAMKTGFVAHPVAVYLHVFASAAALLLGPFQFSAQRRRENIRLHRWMGRVYLSAGVLLGGLSGLYLSQFAFGGQAARIGFAALALCWLYSGWRAYLAIRCGAIAGHRQWMVRNFSLALAAVMLRLYIPASIFAGIDFAAAYPIIAWLCWLPNLLVAEWICKRSHHKSLRRSTVDSR